MSDWIIPNWFLVLIAVVLILYYQSTKNFTRFSKTNIPYHKPLPFVGNMGKSIFRRQYFPDYILEVYKKFENYAYGGIYIFSLPVIVIRDPELIKTIAVKDFEHFTDHRTLTTGGDNVWTKGLFNLKGKRWRDMRSTLSPAFTSSKMKGMFVLMTECSQQVVEFLDRCFEQTPDKVYNIKKEGDVLVLELKDFYTRFSNDVIATTAFGIGVNSLKQPTNDFYVNGQDATYFGGIRAFKLLLFLGAPLLVKLFRIKLISEKATNFFRSLVSDTVKTREREGIMRPDVLQLLMQAKKESDEDINKNKTKLDDEDILAQALLFFLAGFDSISTLLCFASHLLAVHTDVQTKLQDEIDETLHQNGGKLTYEAIHNMKYLDMVVSESLRLYPPAAAVDRVCVKDYTLKSDPPLELYTDDNIYIPILGLHRDPKYFPDPDRFDPERFSDENKHNINPLAYLPFGIGPRNCIGNRFALLETKLAIASILSKFSLKVVEKTPIPIKIVQKGFNMTIDGGFWLGIEKRNA